MDPFLVDAQRTIAYAKATNDPIEAHLSGELAPPVFAVVPIWEALIGAMTTAVPADKVPLLVHGEQDIHIHAPIEPGMRLVSTAEVVGLHAKSSGTTVTVHTRTNTHDGMPVNEQYVVSFIRGWAAPASEGVAAPEHSFTAEGDSYVQVATWVDTDQTLRYAEASGDHNPIHLDEEFARGVGLPGRIVHGLCTMAFTSWLAINVLCDGDPRLLKRVAVRFSQPLLPGTRLTARFWGGHFEAMSDTGAVVVKNGLIERA